MPGYLIAMIEVIDPKGFEEYRQRVPATISAHGGRYLARGGQTEVLEGNLPSKRLAIVEFPSLAQAKAWWQAPDYQPLRAIRERTTRSTLVITDGL
jgi:uncharacterized protein (DUF1330 family)